MNPFIGLAILSGVVYGLLVNGTYFKIYAASLLGYVLLTQLFTSRFNTPRKKINIATWNGTLIPHPA